MIYYILTGVLTYATLGTIQAIHALPRKHKPETLLDKLLIPGVFIILPVVLLIRKCIELYDFLKQQMRLK